MALRLAVFLVLAALAVTSAAAETVSLRRSDGATTTVRAYPPEGACRGIAVLSHGAGGSEAGLGYLGQGLSGAGWLVVAPGHAESGMAALRAHARGQGRGLREALAQLVADPAAHAARLDDIGAALNWAQTWAQARCPGGQEVLIGHSMGAMTVMIEAGARNLMGLRGQRRFDAYVALSPQGPGSVFPEDAWTGIAAPVLMLTGTRDRALEGGWEGRLVPFESLPPPCKWLGVIDGARHKDLGGRGRDSRTGALVMATVTDFLNGARAGDCRPPPLREGMTLRAR